MIRQLVKQGKSTLTVSLHSKWVVKNKLKPGDKVTLDMVDNDINIGIGQVKKIKKQIRLKLDSGHRKSVKILLRNLYNFINLQ